MTNETQSDVAAPRVAPAGLRIAETIGAVPAQSETTAIHALSRNDIAGAARKSTGMPSVAQRSLAGNGAHPVSSSAFAGCAHEFAREEAGDGAGASRRSAVPAEQPEPASQAPARTATSPAIRALIQGQSIQQQGTTLVDLDDAARRALAADRVLERISQVCPQGLDCACAGPPENRDSDNGGCRVYECGECDFRGCAACMEIHESEPHWSDGATMRERLGRDRVIL